MKKRTRNYHFQSSISLGFSRCFFTNMKRNNIKEYEYILSFNYSDLITNYQAYQNEIFNLIAFLADKYFEDKKKFYNNFKSVYHFKYLRSYYVFTRNTLFSISSKRMLFSTFEILKAIKSKY